ncbi:MAG: Fe3+-siderophores ABC transporter protein [Pseudomonadales bacterium]|nr:Fe3+-siderophores ABC transporter protein [Pseudomonadales bacterium]
MRVISLVPSLTETLIDCGINVVGRTRFCIHPEHSVESIAVVGGTKDVNWDLCETLKPDLVVMDREENTLPMAEDCPFPLHATHVTSIESVGTELQKLASVVSDTALDQLGKDWQVLADIPDLDFRGFTELPAVFDRVGERSSGFERIEYMIWRNPWMAVSQQTFIGSVLKKVGLSDFMPDHEKPYPELDASRLPDPDTYYLFSSEPYPFGRHVDALSQAGFNGALVDGEFYSWFGSRSYRLLKQYMETHV